MDIFYVFFGNFCLYVFWSLLKYCYIKCLLWIDEFFCVCVVVFVFYVKVDLVFVVVRGVYL